MSLAVANQPMLLCILFPTPFAKSQCHPFYVPFQTPNVLKSAAIEVIVSCC